MIKYLLLLLSSAFLFSFNSKAQEISIGHRDTLYSHILQDERPLSIYFPPSYYENPQQKFPVLYILDGDYNFRYVTGLIELEGGISETIPEMIVVGISGKGSPQYLKNCKPKIPGIKDSGNADSVGLFIKKELIPYIQQQYKADDYRILAGHSIGGLFVINTALRNPHLFNQYIAISPALWWQGNAINKVAQEVLEKTPDYKSDIYVSLANEKRMGVRQFLSVATDFFWTKDIGFFILSALTLLLAIGVFIYLWKSKKHMVMRFLLPVLVLCAGGALLAYLHLRYYPSNANFKFRHFPNEIHNSVGEPTYRWALHAIFQDWQMDKPYFESAPFVKAHYQQSEKTYGRGFTFPHGALANTVRYVMKGDSAKLQETQEYIRDYYPYTLTYFNTLLASNFMDEKAYDRATRLLQQTLEEYPNDYLVYQKLAEVKQAQDSLAQADSLLTKSITLAKAQHARQWQINELIEAKANLGK